MFKVYANAFIFLLSLLPIAWGETLFDFSSANNASTFEATSSSCDINSLYTWQCNNGQCIHIEELCDGIVHCSDKSDETVDQCLDKPCPAYAFKCAYGACITGDYKCNSIIDCVDGSDETRFLCDPSLNYTQEIRGKCWLSSRMECKSGECISSESACDGVPDCSDGSDETVELCSFMQCPEFSFRCGYGACVSGSAKCNHVRDCRDGSDESLGLCGPDHNISMIRPPTFNTEEPPLNELQPTVVPSRATTTTTTKPDISTRPRTTTRPMVAYTTPYPRNITNKPNIDTSSYDGSQKPGPPQPSYIPPQPTWYPTSTRKPIISYPGTTKFPPTNNKYCRANTLIRGISTVASCTYQNLHVSCYHTLQPGTRAEIFCAPGYKRERKPNTTLLCDNDGEWSNSKFKCYPICGILNEEQNRSVIKPWDVTIMRRTYEPIYEPLCSGAIVSPKIVITAANCLQSVEEKYNTDHIFYNIVEGIYNFGYEEGDRIQAAVHNVSRITIQSSASSRDLALLILVNYFRFNDNLKPICLPSIHNNLSLLQDDRLNIGRAVTRDASREYLEYLIGKIDRTPFGQKTANIEYIRIHYFIPSIMREMQRYKYIL